MSDDLTRLTDEERDSLLAWVSFDTDEGEAGFLEEIESLLAARTAALIDRAERAERERDRLEADWGNAGHELAALRAAVAGLADEWDEQRSHYPTATDARAVGAGAAVKLCAQELRALLTDKGDNQ